LIVNGFGHIGSLNKQRNPVISTVAVKVSSQKVISIDVVSSAFVNENNNVNLVLRINELPQTRVNKSNVSACFVKSSIGRRNFVESEPIELSNYVLIGFMEGKVRVEVFDLLPVLE